MSLSSFIAVVTIAVSNIVPAVAQVSSPIAIPEPSSLSVLGAAAVAFLLWRNKR